VNGPGERLDGQGLGESRHALHEQVPLRQNGHEDAFEKVILADDDLLDFVENAFIRVGRLTRRRVDDVHASSPRQVGG